MSSHDLRRVLVASVREHDWHTIPAEVQELLAQVDGQRLVELATLHRVIGCLALSVPHGAEAPGFRPLVDAAYRESCAQRMRVEADLQRVAVALRDVEWLAMKGPVLAHHCYSRPDLRSYVDLDVLVRVRDFARALDKLTDEGFSLLDRNWTLLTSSLPGELHLATPHGGMVDLHWDVNNDAATRRSYQLRTDGFFERSRDVVVNGSSVRTLDDLDTLIHTAVHAARAGGDRLVWMKDLEQQVLHGTIDWAALAERCREHRAGLPVTVMLQRAGRTLDVPGLTSEVLDSLGGSALLRRAGQWVDRVAPVVSAAPEGSLTRLYARAARGSGRETARELSRRVVTSARRQLAHQAEATTWDAHDPQSVLFPSGGADTRALFFERIQEAP